ncbi:hypothetical protein [Gulosibacter sediminis]|uniref:hypothetical protein n=1 Tax=Gulosibacter sediminis TaxID=1729695 RepID=UPI0024A98DFE|nr:hypothetical protein [Gulosibacter sediminis]
MSEFIDPETGEVVERPIELVASDIANIDEDQLIALFPTPAQAAGALLLARQKVARAPRALRDAKMQLKAAERDLRVITGRVTLELADKYDGMSVSERQKLAASDARVGEAEEARDVAWLALEYAKDWDRALGRDVELLRSVNANFRQEMK